MHADPSKPTTDLSQRLIEAFQTKALKRGSFVLASGKTASFYLDAKQVVLDAAGAMLVGQAVLARLQELGPLPDAVGGMSIGADPITAAVVTMAGAAGLPLKGFMIRKEPKGHGLGRYVEGPVASGNRVVILEDVVTTGGSSLLAIDRAIEFGLQVERVVTLVDRLAGGKEAFAARGIPMDAMITIRDLGIDPTADA
jgi:orotate phosphoribosyltransferase